MLEQALAPYKNRLALEILAGSLGPEVFQQSAEYVFIDPPTEANVVRRFRFEPQSLPTRPVQLGYRLDKWKAEVTGAIAYTAVARPDRLAVFSSPSVGALGIGRLSRLFQWLRDDWKNEIRFVSSADKIVEHPCYQFIIRLGPVMVPFIIEDLRKEANHWFHALRVLTGHTPESRHHGNLGQMRSAWLQWAEENDKYLASLHADLEP